MSPTVVPALLALLAGVQPSGRDPVDEYLTEHPYVRLVASSDLSGCPAAPKEGLQFAPIVRADLTGDKKEDVAFVVVSKRMPHTFGVVALHAADPASREHWVVSPSSKRTRGVGIYSSPWASTCSREAARWQGPRAMNGRSHFTGAPRSIDERPPEE